MNENQIKTQDVTNDVNQFYNTVRKQNFFVIRIPITLDTTPEDKEQNRDNFMANEVSNLEI